MSLNDSNSSDEFDRTVVSFPNDYTTDSLGSLRVSNSFNIFEGLFSFDKQPLIWDESIVGGATSVFNANTNSVDMTVGVAAGDSVVRQTFRRIRYSPSRTIQILAAGNIGNPKTNVRKRIGQFDQNNGVFFEQDGTTTYVVRRTNTSGSVVDIKIPQNQWNIDKFDGQGPSRITIDFSKHHLFYIQYAFQGFGDIVYGFYFEGKVRFCHRDRIANISENPAMKTAHLPCRIEITNTGVSASSTKIFYNSFTVKNEGGDGDFEGQIRSFSPNGVKVVGTSPTPVISIRLRSGFESAIVDIIKKSIFVRTNDIVIWSIYLNPTLVGSNFSNNISFVSIDTNAASQTGGVEILSGTLNQGESSEIISQEIFKLINSYLGSSINGTNQIITISARSFTGTADVASIITWREFP